MVQVASRMRAVLVVAAILFAGGCTSDPQEPAISTGDRPPEELSAAHILIAHSEGEAPPRTPRTKEQALTLAKEIVEKARAKDADFAELAKQYSDGPSGAMGGSLGNFTPDKMVKPFSDATMKLSIGEVSDPVETKFGYHIIRRQEVGPALD